MNVVLAIDTATPAVTAGVVRRSAAGVEVLGERVTVDPRAHAEQLTPNVLAALADAGVGMAGLDAVVVGCGPGPFTGLRVGMATAAAYGHALGLPVFGVCSLDAIGVDTSGDVLVVTDARRREVYWARYRDGARIEGPAVERPGRRPRRGVGGRRIGGARGAVRPAATGAGGPDRIRPGPRRRLDLATRAADPAVSPAARRHAAGAVRAKRPGNPAGAPMTVEYGALTVADADRCADLER